MLQYIGANLRQLTIPMVLSVLAQIFYVGSLFQKCLRIGVASLGQEKGRLMRGGEEEK